jgi:hypothetical protein
MVRRIAVLPEIKAQVSDGDNFEEYCFWDVTVQPDPYLPTSRRKLLLSYTERILEQAGSSKASLNLYETTRRHIPEDNILLRIF